MIQGVAMRSARTSRTTKVASITPASTSGMSSAPLAAMVFQREKGSSRRARESVANADLARARGNPGELRVVLAHADLVHSPGDVAEYGVTHGRRAGGLFERGDVEIRDAAEIMFAANVLEPSCAHVLTQDIVLREQLEHRGQRCDLEVVNRNLGRHGVGQL